MLEVVGSLPEGRPRSFARGSEHALSWADGGRERRGGRERGREEEGEEGTEGGRERGRERGREGGTEGEGGMEEGRGGEREGQRVRGREGGTEGRESRREGGRKRGREEEGGKISMCNVSLWCSAVVLKYVHVLTLSSSGHWNRCKKVFSKFFVKRGPKESLLVPN